MATARLATGEVLRHVADATGVGPNMCLHEPLAHYSPRTARLLDWIHEVGVTSPTDLPSVDLVHGDFHPDNVLVDESGTVTGLVDWDEVSRGDGRYDLVNLRFELGWRDPLLGHWLDGQLREIVSAELLRACWAHVSLRVVDFAIRHRTAADVAVWLEVAELHAFA
ncbi:MAG TPA: aminoglycoside phosphotransferase family protein [Micromonosporaceae bacterium]|nr:aminoglycoside phosphotransferase family protein [Micromonosporaceae bacterium]